jgi:hypothetical protein
LSASLLRRASFRSCRITVITICAFNHPGINTGRFQYRVRCPRTTARPLSAAGKFLT